MGRTGFGNTPDVLRIASAVLSAPPFSIAGWGRPSSFAVIRTLIGIYNSVGNGFNCWRLRYNTSGNAEFAISDGSSAASALSSTVATAAAWSHLCGVAAGVADRRVYLNGGGKGTNATSLTPTGLNRTSIGMEDNVVQSRALAGAAAEIGIWNIALSDADAAILAAGASPLLVHPEALVLYAPLWGQSSPEQNLLNATGLTVVGSVVDANDHPPVYRS